MHQVLYGLISSLLEKAVGKPLHTLDQVRINVLDAPLPENVGLPAFVVMGSGTGENNAPLPSVVRRNPDHDS
jgi:hypothetical protein